MAAGTNLGNNLGTSQLDELGNDTDVVLVGDDVISVETQNSFLC